jgi:hypothetical protein
MRKLAIMVMFLVGTITAVSQSTSREIIQRNPYVTLAPRKVKEVCYTAYQSELSGFVYFRYEIAYTGEGKVKGEFIFHNQPRLVIGQYNGEGTFEGVIYNSNRTPWGIIEWEFGNTNKTINVNISKGDEYGAQFTMTKK